MFVLTKYVEKPRGRWGDNIKSDLNEIEWAFINNNIYLLQLGCHPVAVAILHLNKTRNCLQLSLSREGYMRNMQWQLAILGTISAFAYRHRETESHVYRNDKSRAAVYIAKNLWVP